MPPSCVPFLPNLPTERGGGGRRRKAYLLHGASIEREKPRVTEQWHQDHYDYLQLLRRSEPVATRSYPLQKPCVLSSHTVFETQNPVRPQGDNSVAMGAESSLADIYTVNQTDLEVDCSGLLPLPATLSRETMVEVSDNSEGADCRTTTGAPSLGSVFPEVGIGPFSCAPRSLNERPLHQCHPQRPMVSEQREFDGAFHCLHLQHHQRRGGLAVYSSWNAQNVARHDCGGGGRGYGGSGDGITDGGHMWAGSSDRSAAGLVGSSPTAVWEVEMYRGGSGGGGGVGGCRKRTPVDAGRETTVSCNSGQSTCDPKNLFMCTTMELESEKTSATEEIMKEDNVQLLLHLLRKTRSERDEARGHLQKLLDEIARRSPPGHSPSRPHRLASSFPLGYLPGWVSSPVDSGNTASAAHPTLPREGGGTTGRPSGPTQRTSQFDPASAVIDSVSMNRPLPEKGKLLQAVVEAGPLLKTLMAAGPLPRWRNPPPLQPFQAPSVSINGRESAATNQKATLNSNYLVQSSTKASHRQNPRAASQISAASPLDDSSPSAVCVREPPLLPTCAGTHQDAIGKRQKL